MPSFPYCSFTPLNYTQKKGYPGVKINEKKEGKRRGGRKAKKKGGREGRKVDDGRER